MPSTARVLASSLAVAGLLATASVAGGGPGERERPATSAVVEAGGAAVGSPASGPVSATATGAAAVVYAWPLPDPAVLRPFDDPEQPWLPGHRGVDLASSVGAAVTSAADGVVAFAGQVAGRGVVSVDHADGIRTTYEPLAPVVAAGQRVARGEVLGTLVGGHGSGSDLHWGARTGPRAYVDPTLLVGPPPVIRLWE